MQSAYQRDAPQLPCCCPLLLCCCSAAQVQLVGLCNHWVRLHSCTLPVLPPQAAPQATPLAWLGLGWRVQTFFVSLSWVSISWVSWTKKTQQIVQIHLLFMYFLPHWGNSGQKFKYSRNTAEVSGVHFVNLETLVQVSECSWSIQTIILVIIVSPYSLKQLSRHKVL